MKFFLDTANIDEIKQWLPTGLIDGVTTNPSLIAKSGRQIKDVIAEICRLIPEGDVSAEVTATAYDDMMREANILKAIAENVVIKVPLTIDGLRTCKTLSDEGTGVNVTLCFTANQALLAAKAGARYISPFVGRLDDISHNGLQLIQDILTVYDNYPLFDTLVLGASIRHPHHVAECARMGVDVVTLPAKLMTQLYQHPLTDAGIDIFMKDWAATQQKIA